MTRKSIDIYIPDDPWEKSVQNASKEINGEYLAACDCQLLSRAVANLKCTNDWMEEEKLFDIRAYHLFASHMANNRKTMVFVTHLLFLRDIIENREINLVLHDPITLITTTLAHFIFRECPVHIHINENILRSKNPKAKFVDIGGLMICVDKNIAIDEEMIVDIQFHGEENDKGNTDLIINEIKNNAGISFQKLASREIAPDVFQIDEHYPDINPGAVVWDKMNRKNADLVEIEPGETGLIFIQYEGGEQKSYSKENFDQQFVLV